MTQIGDVVVYNTTEEDRVLFSDNADNVQMQLPAIITAIWSNDCVNLKVIGDDNSNLWRTSRLRGDNEGNWNVIIKS